MKIEAKKCSRCKQAKALYDYYKSLQHSDGLRPECKVCSEIYTKAYRARPDVRVKQKKQSKIRRDARKDYNKKERDKLKSDVLNAYGGKCNCCSESNHIFLSIDHIKGQGTKHRNKIGGNTNLLYRWLRKNNYPKDFQVLCFNCNRAKHFNGICPHQSHAALIAKEKGNG